MKKIKSQFDDKIKAQFDEKIKAQFDSNQIVMMLIRCIIELAVVFNWQPIIIKLSGGIIFLSEKGWTGRNPLKYDTVLSQNVNCRTFVGKMWIPRCKPKNVIFALWADSAFHPTQTDSDHATRVAPNHSGNMISATHTMSCANHMSHSWLPNSTDLHFGCLFVDSICIGMLTNDNLYINTQIQKTGSTFPKRSGPLTFSYPLSPNQKFWPNHFHFHLIKRSGQITFTFT